MRDKKVISVLLFSLFISFNYLMLIDSQLQDFQEALELRSTSGIPIYLTTFQLWTYNIISLICDSIIIAISVGIVGYFVKDIRTYWGLLFGIVSRYLVAIGLLVYSSSSGWPPSLFTEATMHIDTNMYVLLILQVLLTLCFSYLGLSYGKETDYLDDEDQKICYFYGIQKKIWCLILISYIPVAKFLSRFTIVQIYEVTKKISSMSFWKDTFSLSNFFSDDSARGITGLIGHVTAIGIAWFVAIVLFSYGLNAIRHRQTKLRWLKICSAFVVMPAALLIIPIIRNRTWFF